MSLKYKIFRDTIHGNIELHPLCVKIIDTPQFQRLRFIKQLGLNYLVYPGANHSRFEHSIGVCHLAGKLVCALRTRQPELHITDRDILAIQVAGLCHDLGHGPFSHLWELFVRRMRPYLNWKHEKASVAMFDYLIQDNGLEADLLKYGLDYKDVTFIKEVIVKPSAPDSPTSVWPYRGRSREKGFLYQVVANEENSVDVDKWDYVFRDVHSLGLQVTFSYSRLINFSRVIDVSTNPDIPEYKICFRDKEVTNLYDLFHSRMILHRTAYQHRVVKTANTMVLDVLELANAHITFRGKDGENLPLSHTCDDMAAMTYLNDSVLLEIHRSDNPDLEMIRARSLIHNILTRQYYPTVGRTAPLTCDMVPSVLLQEIMAQLSHVDLSEEHLDVQVITLNYGKGKENPIQNVMFYAKHQPNICTVHNPQQVLSLLPLRLEETIYQVVCRSYDPILIQEVKDAFVKACHNLRVPLPNDSPNPPLG